MNLGSAKTSVLDVTDFGAVPDGETLCTEALQKTIDACAEAGGGQVYVPPGVYLTGTLALKDHVTLYLEAGATLLGSARIEDYNPKSVIMAQGARTVGIAGRGTIDGQGQAFWEPREPDTNPCLRCIHDLFHHRPAGLPRTGRVPVQPAHRDRRNGYPRACSAPARGTANRLSRVLDVGTPAGARILLPARAGADDGQRARDKRPSGRPAAARLR